MHQLAPLTRVTWRDHLQPSAWDTSISRPGAQEYAAMIALCHGMDVSAHAYDENVLVNELRRSRGMGSVWSSSLRANECSSRKTDKRCVEEMAHMSPGDWRCSHGELWCLLPPITPFNRWTCPRCTVRKRKWAVLSCMSLCQSEGPSSRSLICFVVCMEYWLRLVVDRRRRQHCAVNTVRWSCAVTCVTLPQGCLHSVSQLVSQSVAPWNVFCRHVTVSQSGSQSLVCWSVLSSTLDSFSVSHSVSDSSWMKCFVVTQWQRLSQPVGQSLVNLPCRGNTTLCKAASQSSSWCALRSEHN